MSEIQRYWSPGGVLHKCNDGTVVRWKDALDHEAAALEAQAEDHREKVTRLQAQNSQNLADQAQRHRKKFIRLVGERNDSDIRFGQLKDKHATELAARDEHLEVALSQHILWQRRHDAVKAELAALRGEGEPALIHFESDWIIGEPCMIHRDFEPALERLCIIAREFKVSIGVTHSMRRLNQKLVGAIVEAAARSNHHAGSAVDGNPVYRGIWYTSKMMEDFESLPSPVQQFLCEVGDSADLRWGGSFGINKDRVHFDDNLVLRDPAEWQRRVEELRGETQ